MRPVRSLWLWPSGYATARMRSTIGPLGGYALRGQPSLDAAPLGPIAGMLLVPLVLERTVIATLDQLRASRVEDMARSVIDLGREVVKLVAAPSGATLLELEALEFVDLIQQPSRRGVQAIIGGCHAASIRALR